MGLMTIPARKLLAFKSDDLWDKLGGKFNLLLDDGPMEVTHTDVCFSSYAWDYHRKYPKTPLLKSHVLSTVLGNKRLGVDSHLDLINNVLWTTYDTYYQLGHPIPDLINDLAYMSDEAAVNLYNAVTIQAEEYVGSLRLTDFLQITMDPEVVAAKAAMTDTEEGISQMNDVVMKIIASDRMSNNPLVKAYRSGIVNRKQVLQCVSVIGFRTDFDSEIFRGAPIRANFISGVKTLRDSMMESRSGTKALMFSEDPLQKSEYFSRRQQFICQNLERLHLVDCGSKHYLLWHVRGKRMEGNAELASDLDTICGKYYLDEETDQLKVIKRDDKHLIGKTIKIRDPVAGCCHPDPQGICQYCFGEIAISIAVSPNTNLGHMTCVTMTSDLGQLILSTKHFDGSAAVEWIMLKSHEKKYLRTTTNGVSYYLNKDLKGKRYDLIVNASQAPSLSDVDMVDDVTKLNLSRISKFEKIILNVYDEDGVPELVNLNVNAGGRNSMFTHDFLTYVKRVGWEVGEGNNYIINMSNWDYEDEFLALPLRHFNMSDHQELISQMLEATMKQASHRNNIINPRHMLMEFHDVVNKRLSINLAVISAIMYSSMVVSSDDNDFSLPKPWTTSGVGVKAMLLPGRSIGPVLGYEGLRESFNDPDSYLLTNRLDHLMDGQVMPQIFNR